MGGGGFGGKRGGVGQEFAQGFDPAATAHDDPSFLQALAVAANRRLLVRSTRITGQLPLLFDGEVLMAAGDRVIAARLDWPGALAAGEVTEAILIARNSGSKAGRRAITPMFSSSPLSPLRAQANATNGRVCVGPSLAMDSVAI